MPQLLALPAMTLSRRHAGPPDQASAGRLEQFKAGDPGRAGIEAFIAQSFLAAYGAQISHFCDVLVGCRGADGAWSAALGYSLAQDAPLFLEHYLDAPIDVEIGKRLGYPVARARIVEVGNLAALHPGAARALIVRTTDLLHGMGLHLVAFTATASLLNSFGRLRLRPHQLAPADPARLPGAGGQWGSYYATQPHVMFGDIRYGHEKLARLFSRQSRPAD
jgi:hypothetical protein